MDLRFTARVYYNIVLCYGVYNLTRLPHVVGRSCRGGVYFYSPPQTN